MRYNDVRHGTNKIDRALKEYKAAWDKKGMVSANGLYVSWIFMNQDQIMPPMDVGLTAWWVLHHLYHETYLIELQGQCVPEFMELHSC